ncbi:M12 family metallo-peptidase [Lewinella cohaerens]|uniref:M12 family metallo-peptidase n=1 Tax=Lewinella cohaerens TaxID=70995 RepID=UPI000377891B|nr:M12 family metallo-peptidase [Lewinella cohaerens]
MRSLTCAYKLLFLLFLGLPFVVTGQASERFVGEDVTFEVAELNQYFSEYQLIRLPVKEINDYVHTIGGSLQMDWCFPDGMNWPLHLEPAPVRAPTFSLALITPRGKREEKLRDDRVNTFKGVLDGKDIRLTINDDFIYGYVRTGDEEWYIEPLKRFVDNAASNTYLLYRTRDVLPQSNLRCGQTETARVTSESAGGARGGCLEVDLAVAADYSMFEHYGSAGGVLAHLEGVLNNVNGNFDDDFSQGLFFRMSELVMPIVESSDPWYSGEDALQLLESFKEWGHGGGFQSDFDLGQFWSRRNYQSQGSGSVIGLSYVGTFCSENGYHILEDFTGSAGYIRVMTAHEIGHNFGCSHNYNGTQLECYSNNRPPYIMDPIVNLATEWSRGIWGFCETNSVNVIDNYLAADDCLTACSPICETVNDLIATLDASEPALGLDWSGEEAGAWKVLLTNTASGKTDTFLCAEPSILLTEEIDLCTVYRARVMTVCSENTVSSSVLIDFNTENTSKLNLEAVRTSNCELASSTYTLDLTVSFETAHEEGFTVQVGEQSYPQIYGTSPQQVSIQHLPVTEAPSVMVKVIPNSNGYLSCGQVAKYRAPAPACRIVVEENFDDCSLPVGWQYESAYLSGAQWLIGDSTREVSNFGGVQNTINGSCMLYFDDDLLGPFAENTGATYLYSAVYDFADYESVELSLVYNFNAFYSHPYSAFTIDVYNGESWVNVLTDETTSGCWPSDAWGVACLTSYLSDLSPFANADFQIRFGYRDGGQWAEFVAMDDFRLDAIKRSSILPVEWGTFTAKPLAKEARLDWTTVQEFNNEGFYIERSGDGRDFYDLAFVASIGDHYELQSYFHFDTRPLPGTSYYRLRQEDLDGSFTYSDVREVTLLDLTTDWEVYPNPVGHDGQLQVSWLQVEDYFTDFELLSATGQVVRRFEVNASPGWVSDRIDLSGVPLGVYFLRHQDGSVKRIVI